MTAAQANAIYDILVADAGATESERDSFVHYVTHGGDEYRIRGLLGFGGKFYQNTMTVEYYAEDTTPERELFRETVNRKLAEVKP